MGPSIQVSLSCQAHIGSHVILKFGRSPDMTIAIDLDIKYQQKQTTKQVMWSLSQSMKVKVLLTNHYKIQGHVVHSDLD